MLKTLAAAALLAPALGQSSKFAAVYSDEPKVLTSCAYARTESELDLGDLTGCVDGFDSSAGYTFGTIRVPQQKEILVSLSAQIGLATTTIVQGKRGSKSTAVADAAGSVVLFACSSDLDPTVDDYTQCLMAKPGLVVLNQREQSLEAVLGGVIEECTFDGTPDGDGNLNFNLGDCVVQRESIGLAISTLSAQSFQFLFPDMASGEYTLYAHFMTEAQATASASCPADALYCEDGDGAAGAVGLAFVGKYMMTAQEVRAVRNADFDQTIIEVDVNGPSGNTLSGFGFAVGALGLLAGAGVALKSRKRGEQTSEEVVEAVEITEA